MFRGIWRKVYTLCTTQGVACSRHVPLPWLLSILHTTARSGFLLMSPLFLQFSFLFALARESRNAKILWWTAWEGNKFDNFYTDCLLTFFNGSRFFLHTLPRNHIRRNESTDSFQMCGCVSQVKSAARNHWAIHFPFIFAASIRFDNFGQIPTENFF